MQKQWLTTSLVVVLAATFVAGCTEERTLGAGDTRPGVSMGSAERTQRIVTPTPALIGREVVDLQGERIGEVDSVAGDQVVVTTGGFLGMGTRRVALDAKQLTTVGSGGDLKLQTSLTQAQLRELPEVRNSPSERSIFRR